MLKALTPMIGVLDVDASMAFYCGRLGFEMRGDFVHDGVRQWASLTRENVELMVTREDGAAKPDAAAGHRDVILYFYTDDVLALHGELTDAGCEIVGPRVTFYQMKEIELADPDGYRVWFGQHSEEPPTPEE